MDHHQPLAFELDRHHLQRNPFSIVTQEDKPRACADRRLSGWFLLEPQTALLDDVARAFTGYPVLGCRACPFQIHTAKLYILSDNISSETIRAQLAASTFYGNAADFIGGRLQLCKSGLTRYWAKCVEAAAS